MTVSVTYNAVFTPFERQLAGLGMNFHEHLDVFGMDPPGSLTGTFIASVPPDPVRGHGGRRRSQTIPRCTQMVMSRTSLQEDPGRRRGRDPGQDPHPLRRAPAAFTPDTFTDEEILLG